MPSSSSTNVTITTDVNRGNENQGIVSSLLFSARMTSLLDEDQDVSHSNCDRRNVSHWQQTSNEFLDKTSYLSPGDSTTSAGLELEGTNDSSPSSAGASVPDMMHRTLIPCGGTRSLEVESNMQPEGGQERSVSAAGLGSNNRDSYVRTGTHFRSLLDNALQKVAIGFSNSGDIEMSLTNDNGGDCGQKRRNRTNERESSRPQRKRRLNRNVNDSININEHCSGGTLASDNNYASELAKEKLCEVMSLQKALVEAEDHSKAVSRANSSLRDASATLSARLVTLSEALRIAGEKAANARADADAAEARASSLTTQIKSFKNALDGTKRTIESIRSEHDDISSASRNLKSKLLQAESNLSNVRREKRERDLENANVCRELKHLKKSREELKDTMEKRDDELLKLKKIVAESENIENARLARTNRLENELRKARSMLIEMTSASAEGETITLELRGAIGSLKKENESLNHKIDKSMDNFSKERTKVQQALMGAENEAQKLRLQAAADDEEYKRLKLDKTSSEKEVLQLRNRLSKLERRLVEQYAIGGSSSHDHSNDVSSTKTGFTASSTSSGKENSSFAFNIPRLKSNLPKATVLGPIALAKSDKYSKHVATSHKGNRVSQNKCSICSKAPYGIMKSCQCEDPLCHKRAHVTCISGKNPLPSVSHPGTPAPCLPIILCKRNENRCF